MTKTTQLIASIVGFILVGYLVVGTSEKSDEEKKNDALISGYAAMSSMASKKCPKAIKEHTQQNAYFPTSTDTDRTTYMILKWENQTGKFKNATCYFERAQGGISKLEIDGKIIIER